jgi:hypothetical protein
MPSAKKQKKKQFQKVHAKQTPERQEKKPIVIKPPATEAEKLKFALIVTGCFLLVAIFGMLIHEMWRDEHQAWLVARDAHSIPQVFQNMRYEGNPALWHLLLFFITRFSHNPVWMQVLHVIIATSSIFIFNRYAPIKNLYKILFSFGYFPLYEYAVISRSYALGVLLLFIACALYKNRLNNYILIGVVLALLANVTITAIYWDGCTCRF